MFTFVDMASAPMDRKSFTFSQQCVLGDGVEGKGEDVNLSYNEGIVEISKSATGDFPAEVYDLCDRKYAPLAGGVKSVDFGKMLDEFCLDNEIPDDEPLLLIHTDSFRLPDGVDVTMSYLPLDETMLIILLEGALKIANADGEELELVREYFPKNKKELRYGPSVTNDDFEGVPSHPLYRESFLTVTVKRNIGFSKIKGHRVQNTEYMNMTSSFKIHQFASVALDNGRTFEDFEDARAIEEAAKAEAEERRRLNKEKHAAEVEEMLARRESRDAAPKRNARRTNAASAPVEEEEVEGEYSPSAKKFLESLG